MEKLVTMDLEYYTNLITELALLREERRRFNKIALKQIKEEIKDGLINQLKDKEEIINWLTKSSEGDLIAKFTDAYTWTWSEIAENTYIEEDKIKEVCCQEIKKLLNNRLNDLGED